MDTTTKTRGTVAYWRQLLLAVLGGAATARAAHPPDLYRSTTHHGPVLR